MLNLSPGASRSRVVSSRLKFTNLFFGNCEPEKIETLSNFRDLPPGHHQSVGKVARSACLNRCEPGRDRAILASGAIIPKRWIVPLLFFRGRAGQSAGLSEDPAKHADAFSRTSAVLEASWRIRIGVANTTLVLST